MEEKGRSRHSMEYLLRSHPPLTGERESIYEHRSDSPFIQSDFITHPAACRCHWLRYNDCK